MTRLPIANSRAEALANFDKMTEASRFSASLITAALAMPHTHEVVTTYADGRERRFGTRSLASAESYAAHAERHKIGRDLIDRATGKTVRVVSVDVRPIDPADREMAVFQVGKTYTDRAAGDHTMIYRWKVIARTPKSLTLRNMNRTVDETFRRGVRVYEGIERCSPNGRYSMAPVISADCWED